MKPGDQVNYRSLAGQVYPATVTGTSVFGFAINVEVPGCREPVHFSSIPADRLSSRNAPPAESTPPDART